MNKIILGNCLDKLKGLPDNSIDSIVTDPPYELGFMGKSWDSTGIANNVEMWKECLRVLKPGGHLLSFGGTRTYHRMACAIEDAGFEVRDMISWIYASGFPKSLNVYKQLKKQCTCGNMEEYENTTKQTTKHNLRPMSETNLSQEVSTGQTEEKTMQSGVSEQNLQVQQSEPTKNVWGGERILERGDNLQTTERELQRGNLSEMSERVFTNGEEGRLHNATQISDGSTFEQVINENGSGTSQRPQPEQQQDRKPCTFCKQWGTQATRTLGIGTALKPACEPCVLARKPLSEKTVAENVLKWGTGGINIDGSRVGMSQSDKEMLDAKASTNNNGVNFDVGESKAKGTATPANNLGRFPANLIHDGSEQVLGLFPDSKSSNAIRKNNGKHDDKTFGKYAAIDSYGFDDSGSAARFFYCAKTSKSERNKGLDSTLTVKYTGDIWKEENIVAAQLLKKVTSDMAQMSFSTGESGESLMVRFPKDSSFITKTIINKIMTSQILNLLMHSLTNESTLDVNLEVEVGGNHVENVENLKKWLLTITNENLGLAHGASRVALQMLSQISNEENWKDSTNFHSTVKPQALMKYLIKLITPPGGIVLDPFAGSGSTLVAAKDLGHNYIGIEMTEEYIPIINARLNN